MRATLAKNLAEKDARAKDNRRLFSGRVLRVNAIKRTVDVDVREEEILYDVPYTGQTPPNIGDVGDLVYSNSSNHSVRFTNPRLSSGNVTPQLGAGVSSFNGLSGTVVKGVDWNLSVLVSSDDALTADPTKLYLRVVNNGTTGRTITLPDPSVHRNPIWIRVLAAPAGGHTLSRFGSENVDGVGASVTLGDTAGKTQEICLVSNGTDWFSITRLDL